MSEYELYHHGVKGQKWGVRKEKYQARIARKQRRIDKNNERIAKREKQLSTVGARKRAEKAAYWQRKADKIDSKFVTRRAKARLAVGKKVTRRQQAALIRSSRAHAKVANYSKLNDKYKESIAYLERKNARTQRGINRLNRKINRLDKKMAKEQLKSQNTQKKVSAGKKAVNENPKIKAAMKAKASSAKK